MRGVLVLFLLAQLLSGCVTMTQIRLDAEVDRRCREDGGLKVYETIPTPPEMFKENGIVNFFDITKGENALGENYIFKYNRTFLTDDAQHTYKIWRSHYQIIRKLDKKLIGESVTYYRYGGDPKWINSINSGPESSYSCKKNIDVYTLLKNIFIPTTKRGVRP